MAEFQPGPYEELIEQLTTLSDTPLKLQKEAERVPESPFFPIRVTGQKTDYGVAAEGTLQHCSTSAETAAQIIGRLFAAEQDVDGLYSEVTRLCEELDFLYDLMSNMGALLDEDDICAYAVEKTAQATGCKRASIMLAEPDSEELRIRASVGIPEHIVKLATVKPGERISGKVFQSARRMMVNDGDPMPSDSLNIAELKESYCFLSVPLKAGVQQESGEQVLGVFNLTSKRGGSRFTMNDLKLLNTVAMLTAAQIHRARLIRAQQAALEGEKEEE